MNGNAAQGSATGTPLMIVRSEGAAVFAAATALYFLLGGPWWLYAVLLFAPDLSFLGYAAGSRTGTVVYNLAHTFVVPLALGLIAVVLKIELLQHLALIHLAHIGLDRALGYGLKYASGFKDTHLGRLKGGKHEG